MGYHRRWVPEGFSASPLWALGEEPGLLPGLIRVDGEEHPSFLAEQRGGSISSLRCPRRVKEASRIVRDSNEVEMYGWNGRRRRTDGRDRAIRRYRRVIKVGGGDRWFNPDLEPEPEWDPDEEAHLRQVLKAWAGE